MRFALACASALSLLAGTAGTAVITVDTSYSNHFSFPESNLDIGFNVIGLQNIGIDDVRISGWQEVDFRLNRFNTGTIETSRGILSLANTSQAFAGLFLNGSLETIGVGMDFVMGPESVVNRNFTIDSSTVGGLSLNSGFVKLTITGGALAGTFTGLLGTNVWLIDLADNPLVGEFSSLGATTLQGIADDDTSGFAYYELNTPLSFASSYDLEGIPLTVTMSGNLFVCLWIPEFSSLGFVSLAAAGLGAVIAVRRGRRSVWQFPVSKGGELF